MARRLLEFVAIDQKERERERERERDASACMRRLQGFALAPVPLIRKREIERDASACMRRLQGFGLAPVLSLDEVSFLQNQQQRVQYEYL